MKGTEPHDDERRYGTVMDRIEAGGGSKGILQLFISPFTQLGPRHILLLMIIILIGSYIRLYGTAESGLVIDEATKVDAVEDYSEGRFWVNLEHPPLEKYLILISTSVFGVHDWSVKLPNAILGSLTPLLLFILVSRIGKGPWPGLAAALIGSLSPVMIGYSMIAKEDTLLNFLSLAAAVVLIGILGVGERKGMDLHHPDRQGMEVDRKEKGRSGFLERMDPRSLDRREVLLGILVGASLASKYTMVFILLSWSIYLLVVDRDFLRKRGPRILSVSVITFAVISWYYLNPYWLGLGIYHWMVESVGGHLTYFMGNTYQYPPPWFYPVVLFGRVHPMVLISSVGTILVYMACFLKRFRRGYCPASLRRRTLFSTSKCMFDRDRGLWLLIIWFLVMLIIMTLLPFKGVRYIQWIMVPMIALSALGIWKASTMLRKKVRPSLVFLIMAALMSMSVVQAHPYYTEWSYFFHEDSGVKDLNGMGHGEALEWVEGPGNGGRVSMRWTLLGEYYYDNVTGPVSSIEEVRDNNVSYILLYIYDLQRGVLEDMTAIARSGSCELVHEIVHGSVSVIWIYRVLPEAR
ncbi:MAG: glycosyltransferase family 39 protein [Thermoplasmatota archaeon]